MAVVKKKRYRSRSPEQARASKRTHKESFHISPRLQATGYNASSSGTGSARDSSLPQKQDREKSLPTGEDWLFRVKVISSVTNLSNDLFNNAVQGLVKICFPDGILDQLGLQVLEQHMREEKAPTANIQRMTEVFQSEMIQRLTSMLAEYLDTPAKVELAVHATVATTARLHGEPKLGEDIFSHISTSLLHPKARTLGDSTEWLASGYVLQNTANGDGDTVTSDVSKEEHAPTPKANKPQKRDRKCQLPQLTTHILNVDDNGMDINVPALPVKNASGSVGPLHKGKDRRISTKWKWDIKPGEHSEDAIVEIFTRTSDLFAYHALPIARQKLGSGASRKEIRSHMQSMLDNIHGQEFEKWVESLEKLLDGDYRMLERGKLPDRDAEQHPTRITPAPVDIHREVKKNMKIRLRNSIRPNIHLEIVGSPPDERSLIKREAAAWPDTLAERSQEARPNTQITASTSGTRQPSTELRNHAPRKSNADARDAGNAHVGLHGLHVGLTMDNLLVLGKRMPVMSLLYGSEYLTINECVNGSVRITQSIMENLDRRIVAKRIGIRDIYNSNKVSTRVELRSAILWAFPRSGEPVHLIKIKKSIEGSLIPWVLAELRAFPELKTKPFVFTHMMPLAPVMINRLFKSWRAVSKMRGHQVWTLLIQVILPRGMSEASLAAADIDDSLIEKVCDYRNYPDVARRVSLERVLRRLAFEYRDEFMDLKNTAVVTAWEKKTGLVW
ncbi:hypothetical protein PTNB73_03139 [Pyrenophora teres f. teres]|nr:hypothetical protein PTNB73_03139 [Pyrenophora teres f. teres]